MSTVASAVLMVEPTTFGFDEQTAETNVFASQPGNNAGDVEALVMAEYRAVVAALKGFGVNVWSYAHADGAPRPNAVFPNNWLTTWPDGRVYLYPMATPSRRLERSTELLLALRERFGMGTLVDVSGPEKSGEYLESTGVMIFDHAGKAVYACESLRCNRRLLEAHAEALGYKPMLFQAEDEAGTAIYHTNIMLGIQSTTAVLCAEAIKDMRERQRVLESLESSGHAVVEINEAQMNAYCGNVIELANASGERCLLLSQSAYDAYTPGQRAVLSTDKKLLPIAVPTIQAIGGGSVRCMVAEIFLPALVEA
jgi:hypothetical protein